MLLRPPTLHLFAANVVIGHILFLLQQCPTGANFVCVTIKIILILLCLEVLIFAAERNESHTTQVYVNIGLYIILVIGKIIVSENMIITVIICGLLILRDYLITM